MSRSIDYESRAQQDRDEPRAGERPSESRAGGSSSSAKHQALVPHPGAQRVRLAALIDRAAEGRPPMGEFIERLERSGIAVLPSIQTGGRLNGLSYRFEGTTFNGSLIGRGFTARGIQHKKGVDYQPSRDFSALVNAVERGGMRRETPARSDDERLRQRESRERLRDTGLTPSQHQMLSDIGKFRTVGADDLIAHRYDGDAGKFERDLRGITERGLAERRVITHGRVPKTESVLTLTASGRNLIRRATARTGGGAAQQFYAGFVKPSEVSHDIGIYKMYQQEAARIEREGGTVRRVVLDFELKKRVFGELNKPGDQQPGAGPAERKQRIASLHGLSVVEGRVVLPDLRIEYETRDQEIEKVDLELTSGHYKESQIQAKRAAGFKLYAPDSGLGSPAHYDPEIVGGLVSL